MTNNPENFEKVDLKKLDEFIQSSLDKYFYVKPWDELYKNTGKHHKDIISDKSIIPDMVIYNKTFNKLDCFYQPNIKKSKPKINFLRKCFILRPKKNKKYKYPSSNQNIDNKNKEEQKEPDQPFKFKTIPKDLENKYVGNNNSEENKEFNELKDFMGNDENGRPKVQLIKENSKVSQENKNIKNYQKNDFYFPTFNNYNLFIQKMIQNIEFQNLINQKNGIQNRLNSNLFFFKEPSNESQKENRIINEQNIFNENINDNKVFNIEEHNKNFTQELKEIQKYTENLEEFMLDNMTERVWLVVNEPTGLIHKYNNEELYYFLNIIKKNNEEKKNSIYSTKFPTAFIPQKDLLEALDKIFNPKTEIKYEK